MKPNDKAYRRAYDAFNITAASTQDALKAAVDAAYAAQFPPSEDYAGLISALRTGLAFSEKNNDAADAIETLLAKLNNKPKPSEDYAGLVKKLRSPAMIFYEYNADKGTIIRKAADALEAVLAERDTVRKELIDEIKRLDRERIAWKGQQEETAALLKQVEAERDALLARLAPEDDKELVEIAVKTIFNPPSQTDEHTKRFMSNRARAAIAAIRPHIEAVERERCAKIAETPELWVTDKPSRGCDDIAAAIRSGK